ncbi:PTS transporter subunit EIIC [Kocuria sp. JC486]|uniref:PTS N-acetylglucosamine transporter subunit IIBC n=1 Tax=Kocuria soli TaxID=2485125 RepID=A0A3N3ZSD9_9MICC|nr:MULTISPECIES: PTS transporter subunit EIIC [Kocuria]NHU85552.1 PTS transporter subunit EIIC [Kocuria sp. JC486]ROZ64373.1 PTS N-acetylglucosamine transporter subunit IIBC [Kocuria soli]
MGRANVGASADAAREQGKQPSKALIVLQRFGRSLMLPIASLPAAALLLRLGQDDLLGRFDGLHTVAAVFAGAGNALFENLGLLFAVGIAFGFAKKGDGSTALAAVVGYLVLTNVFDAMAPVVLGPGTEEEPPVINYGVLAGILVGFITAKLWERFHRTKLPDWLGFFGGRRLVPMMVAVVCLVLGVLLAFPYPLFSSFLTWAGETVAENDVLGGGVYGVANRLLIPLGLHHLLNFFPWFQLGDFNGSHGDIARFFAGDPAAGTFMTGFFPIMMFALPAAALAITHEAKPENRKAVGGVMLSVGLTSFVTGITEPLEFAFMFVAWPLYLVHAVLTGTSMALVNALDIHMGFGFSAGAIDYLLNFGIGQRAWLIIPIGLAYALIYYIVFRFVIRLWNLRTPGREEEGEISMAVDDELQKDTSKKTKGARGTETATEA